MERSEDSMKRRLITTALSRIGHGSFLISLWQEVLLASCAKSWAYAAFLLLFGFLRYTRRFPALWLSLHLQTWHTLLPQELDVFSSSRLPPLPRPFLQGPHECQLHTSQTFYKAGFTSCCINLPQPLQICVNSQSSGWGAGLRAELTLLQAEPLSPSFPMCWAS